MRVTSCLNCFPVRRKYAGRLLRHGRNSLNTKNACWLKSISLINNPNLYILTEIQTTEV